MKRFIKKKSVKQSFFSTLKSAISGWQLKSWWLVLILGFGLRLVLALRQPLWIDEGASWYIAKYSSWSDLVLGNYTSDPHPPLHYILLKSVMPIIGDAPWALRLSFVTLGTALIYLVYDIVLVIYRHKATALFAAVLIAVNPILVWYSAEARIYMLALFFQVVCVYSVIQLAEKTKKYQNRYVASFSLGVVGAMFTTFSSIFALLGIASAGAFFWWQGRSGVKRKMIWLLLFLVIGVMMGMGWLYHFIFVLPTGSQALVHTRWIVKPDWRYLLHFQFDFLSFRWEKYSYLGSWGPYFMGLFAGMIILGWEAGKLYLSKISKNKKYLPLLMVGISLGVIPQVAALGFSHFIKPVFLSRQLLIVPVGITLLLVPLLTDQSLKYRRWSLLIFILGVSLYSNIHNFFSIKSNLPEILQKYQQEFSQATLFVHSDEISFLFFNTT